MRQNPNSGFHKRALIQDDFWNGLVIKEQWPKTSVEVTLKEINTDEELEITSRCRWLTSQPGKERLKYKLRSKSNISTLSLKKVTNVNKSQLPIDK